MHSIFGIRARYWGAAGVLLGAVSALAQGTSGGETAARSMTTQFTCKAVVPAQTQAKTLDIWVPLPSDSEYQKVEKVEVEGSPYKITQEPVYKNRMVFVHLDKPQADTNLLVRYTLTRHEMHPLGEPKPRRVPALSAEDKKRFTAPEKSMPVGGRFQTISDSVVTPSMSVREKARAIYEHCIKTLAYDYKSESPKSGQGDAEFVCDYKKGECTDLHSYLISLARTQGIPILHEYGFSVTGIPLGDPIPEEAKIATYHCYTRVYLPDYGWVPVDASDGIRWADKNRRDMMDFQFGGELLERNAVCVSQGRNLILNPPQQGAPVNKFIYPYAEADGQPVAVKAEMTRKILKYPPPAPTPPANTGG